MSTLQHHTFEMIHTCSEGHHTSPQVAQVEGHIYARKRYHRKSALELEVTFGLLQFLGVIEGFHDNIAQHLFYFLDREFRCQLCKHINKIFHKKEKLLTFAMLIFCIFR